MNNIANGYIYPALEDRPYIQDRLYVVYRALDCLAVTDNVLAITGTAHRPLIITAKHRLSTRIAEKTKARAQAISQE